MSQSVLTVLVGLIVCWSCLPLTMAVDLLSDSSYRQQVVVNPLDVAESCCNCSNIQDMVSTETDAVKSLLTKVEQIYTDVFAKIESSGGKLS